jgi:3-oxoacyl-[acyl-carrier-protein] synthase-3
VSVGQVIGLIEAMKLFNEIKSDLRAGWSGSSRQRGIVKAKSPLIEVDRSEPSEHHAHDGGRSVRLTGWGRYAPAQALTNADLERMVDTSRRVDRLVARGSASGGSPPRTRRQPRWGRRGPPRDPDRRHRPEDIDVIILATLTPDLLDALDGGARQGGHRQHEGGRVRRDGGVLRVRLSLRDAQAYIAGGLARHVLVIGAELLTRVPGLHRRATCILFGDGAGRGAVGLRRARPRRSASS